MKGVFCVSKVFTTNSNIFLALSQVLGPQFVSEDRVREQDKKKILAHAGFLIEQFHHRLTCCHRFVFEFGDEGSRMFKSVNDPMVKEQSAMPVKFSFKKTKVVDLLILKGRSNRLAVIYFEVGSVRQYEEKASSTVLASFPRHLFDTRSMSLPYFSHTRRE